MQDKLGYVSLFSSAGVGCYGFNLEGFDCIATSELIARRMEVQKANNVCSLPTGYITGDIKLPATLEKINEAIENWKKTYKRNEVDVIVATPPCQGISVANHKKNNEIVRNSLVVESIALVASIAPRYFIFENVRGFMNTLCTDIDGEAKPIKEAIQNNLSGLYNIEFKVMNFKDYGNNSSRTRTVVVGVRKDIEEITPYDLFPAERAAPTLKELIGDLRPLKNMGEIEPSDIYHMFRPYQPHMLEWIKDLKEGQSAFDNEDPLKRPHKFVDGVRVANVNKNGDKYTRCSWDKVAPCVHTRNDILASQATIHPEDPRVFSIRELMRFMGIPEGFKWVSEPSFAELNSLTVESKKAFLKKNEINIRQCLGEAVPTPIFKAIAHNIVEVESKEKISINKIKRLIEKEGLDNTPDLLKYLASNKLDFSTATKIAELANAKRLDDAAFYTRQEVCFNLVHDLPSFDNKKSIRILEPSVGVGNFLPTIFAKYKNKEKVLLDLVDINEESIAILKQILKFIDIPNNFELRFINDDFLTHEFRVKYDVVVGNPPYGAVDTAKYQDYIKFGLKTSIRSKNLFALFIEKSLSISSYVAFITPKSLLNAPEFIPLRNLIEQNALKKINDYGEKGFKGVKIETISTHISRTDKSDTVRIESFILNTYEKKAQSYVCDNAFPCWLIYRDEYFDKMTDKLELGIFDVLRDRALTSKHMKPSGSIKVIKSRNIGNGTVSDTENDLYINDTSASPTISKYYGKSDLIVAPNLSYYPRAAILPNNTVVDGSAALLLPKDNRKITAEELGFFASREFYMFYRIARNYATRSLNIDSSSVMFWGLPKNTDYQHAVLENSNRSNYLFALPASFFPDSAALAG